MSEPVPPVGKLRLEGPSPTTSARLVCLHGSRFPSGEGTGESSLARAAPHPPHKPGAQVTLGHLEMPSEGSARGWVPTGQLQ